MTSLRDIAKYQIKVPIGDGDAAVIVTGISAQGFAVLLEEFPALREFMADRAKRKEQLAAMDPADIIKAVPAALGHIIAAGCNEAGDPESIEAARNLPAGVQLEIIAAIIKTTFPRGVASFIAALDGLHSLVDGESGKAPGTNSPEQSSN